MIGNGLIQKRAADLGFARAWVKKNPDFNPSKNHFFKKKVPKASCYGFSLCKGRLAHKA